MVGLLGPNGAGKTTTFNLVIGLLSPDQGEVTVNGERVTHLPMPERARLGVGYLPQEVITPVPLSADCRSDSIVMMPASAVC